MSDMLAMPSSNNSNNPNLFQQVLTDVNGVSKSLLGEPYEYWAQIKTPSEIGMSDRGSLSALGNNISGLIQYVSVLIDGKGASKTGEPLGNKFFLKTGGKCVDNTETEQERFIYINNVPQGNIPFISGAMGVNFSEFKGLIPGTVSNLNALNPFGIMQSFMSGSKPKCQQITLETIDNNNNKGNESHFVTLVDLQNMDPCSFPNRKNPITKKDCRETFHNKNNNETEMIPFPNDIL